MTTHNLDKQILLTHVLNVSRAYLLAHPEIKLNDAQQKQFDELLARRNQGEPIAYLTGHREFWSLDLTVTKDTLIPRHETELLVEIILQQYSKEKNLTLLELGTGSGAISLALTKERPHWQITATDIDEHTLAVAKQNAQHLQLSSIQFVLSNWFDALEPQLFELIVSNPPYIAENDLHLTQGDLRFEPQRALTSGKEGLDAITQIIKTAPRHLIKHGWLFLEHGYDQKEAVQHLFQQMGYKNIQTHQDLAGHPRVTQGQWL